MPTVVKDFISGLGEQYPHVFSVDAVLQWINELELNDYADISKAYASQSYARVKGSGEFTLPAGVNFEDVRFVYVDGVPYQKRDILTVKKAKTYYFNGGKLNIYPVSDVDDAVDDPRVTVYYQVQPVKKLIANIATDELLIPDRFEDIYTLYCIYKICLFSKEFAEAGNWQELYNKRFAEYQAWYNDVKPMQPELNIIAEDGDW